MNDPHLPALREGLSLQQKGLLAQAESIYRRVLAADPNHAMALQLLGVALAASGRAAEALRAFQASVKANPRDAVAQNNLANALKDAGDLPGGMRACEAALQLNPVYVKAYCTRAALLAMQGEYQLAFEDVQRALTIDPQSTEARSLHEQLRKLSQREDASGDAGSMAASLWPNLPAPLLQIGRLFMTQGQFEKAIQAFERLLNMEPDHPEALGYLLRAKIHGCDWDGLPALVQQAERQAMAGVAGIIPLILLACSDNPVAHRCCAQAAAGPSDAVPRKHSPRRPERIKVGYFSADLREHATAYLMAELFELHDRSRFEWVALSFGPNEPSAMRTRLEQAFDQFVDVREWSDAQVAQWAFREQIDIAVDLKGYTDQNRIGIFRHRPAPVAVNYLGYPGTLGLDCFDYIIGDPVVTPFDKAAHYAEKIVQMPACYQVNDRKRRVADATPSRRDEGLPSAGFVFAAFHQNFKIGPEVFAVWMRLLRQVPGSVLWLLGEGDSVRDRLRRHAQAGGVDPHRVVFGERKELSLHLARHRLADLFLDTLPYNAHTSTSDALWAGLPVVTCMGEAFAGRVAASLLTAVGMPELITHDLRGYEALALRLATQPEALEALKSKLRSLRSSAALFDTPTFARNLESAYSRMADRFSRGLPPEAFSVDSQAIR